MGKGNKLEFKQEFAFKEAVTYLEALVESFKTGTIVVRKGEEIISLNPSEKVEVEITARTKKDKGKFSLEISWHEPDFSTEKLSISPAEEIDQNETKSETKE